MKPPVTIIGMGEMGSVFARGFLRLGHPVFPVVRSMNLDVCCRAYPEPELVVIAVAESDLQPVLRKVPLAWSDRLCLLQNELLPQDWADIPEPTVISVWFEKKKGMEAKVIIPSPVYGPGARLVAGALGVIGIPTRVLEDDSDLLFELVVKNLYILTSNLCGLAVGGSVGELWDRHQYFDRGIAEEIIELQAALTGEELDREALIHAMTLAFAGDPGHGCMGRSAPVRLARALEHADALGLALPRLRALPPKPEA